MAFLFACARVLFSPQFFCMWVDRSGDLDFLRQDTDGVKQKCFVVCY